MLLINKTVYIMYEVSANLRRNIMRTLVIGAMAAGTSAVAKARKNYD